MPNVPPIIIGLCLVKYPIGNAKIKAHIKAPIDPLSENIAKCNIRFFGSEEKEGRAMAAQLPRNTG
jgi:hypothetical protein